MQRWRLIVRDIVVSVTLHLDIVIIFHVAARCVLQLKTIRWLTLEYRSYFSWRAFIFTVLYDFRCITVDRDRSSFSILLHDTFVADNERFAGNTCPTYRRSITTYISGYRETLQKHLTLLFILCNIHGNTMICYFRILNLSPLIEDWPEKFSEWKKSW